MLLVTTFLSRRDLSLAVLLPTLGVAQYVLHHAFGILSVSGMVVPVPGMHDGISVSMTAAHVAATVATALVLVGGDRAARMALHWWFSALPLVQRNRPATLIRVRHLVRISAVQVRRPCAALRRADPRRGPPPSLA